jgi:hypothetical protein
LSVIGSFAVGASGTEKAILTSGLNGDESTLMLRSPNGAYWYIKVDDSGTLYTTNAP